MQSTNDIEQQLKNFCMFLSEEDNTWKIDKDKYDKLTALSKTIREEERETWETTQGVKIKWVFKDNLREKPKLVVKKKRNKCK